MALCPAPELPDFVSDCADVVCASELTTAYFLSSFVSSAVPQRLFSTSLIGSAAKCGSVDLSLWLDGSFSDESSGPPAMVEEETVPMESSSHPLFLTSGVVSLSTKVNNNASSVSSSGPSYVWRPTVLAVLCFVLLLTLIVDTVLLMCVQRKRKAKRKELHEQDYTAST